jgi:hypothetical protein
MSGASAAGALALAVAPGRAGDATRARTEPVLTAFIAADLETVTAFPARGDRAEEEEEGIDAATPFRFPLPPAPAAAVVVVAGLPCGICADFLTIGEPPAEAEADDEAAVAELPRRAAASASVSFFSSHASVLCRYRGDRAGMADDDEDGAAAVLARESGGEGGASEDAAEADADADADADKGALPGAFSQASSSESEPGMTVITTRGCAGGAGGAGAWICAVCGVGAEMDVGTEAASVGAGASGESRAFAVASFSASDSFAAAEGRPADAAADDDEEEEKERGGAKAGTGGGAVALALTSAAEVRPLSCVAGRRARGGPSGLEGEATGAASRVAGTGRALAAAAAPLCAPLAPPAPGAPARVGVDTGFRSLSSGRRAMPMSTRSARLSCCA